MGAEELEGLSGYSSGSSELESGRHLVTTQDEQVFPYYRSPSAIRDQEFTHRMRGLDEAEVYEYLDLLADQVQSTEIEQAELRADQQRLRTENERLRAENERLRAAPRELAPVERTPETVALFSQAQQVADQVVEEAVRHARDLIASARSEQREILQRAREEAAAQPPAVWSDGAVTPSPELDYVRTFARVAQVQLRSVVQALAEQVERLGEFSGSTSGPTSGPPATPEMVGRLPVPRPREWPHDGHRLSGS